MEEQVKLFLKYLNYQKGYSENTIINYENDIKEFLEFLNKENIDNLKEVNYSNCKNYS